MPLTILVLKVVTERWKFDSFKEHKCRIAPANKWDPIHLPEKHLPEITFPRKTLGRNYIIPNIHFPERAFSKNYISLNIHLPEITFS